MTTQKTILLVEDEALIAIDMEIAISDLGFDVITARTIDEALRLIETRQIDFAVLDFKVGQDDTTGIATLLRDKQIGFALCSGSDVQLARQIFGDAPFIPKPYSQDLLQATLQTALGAGV